MHAYLHTHTHTHTHTHARTQVLKHVREALEQSGAARTEDLATILWALAVMSSDVAIFYQDQSFLATVRAVMPPMAVRLQEALDEADGAEAEAGVSGAQGQVATHRNGLAAGGGAGSGQRGGQCLCMLHQFFTSLKLDAAFAEVVAPDGDGASAMHAVGERLAARCRAAFGATDARDSKMQARISKVLAENMGLSVIAERHCERTGYTIDLEVAVGDRKWFVEIDGPSHFFQRPDEGALGGTLLKQHQLALAYPAAAPPTQDPTVVALPYWEWDAIDDFLDPNTGTAAQEEYLQRKLGLLDGRRAPEAPPGAGLAGAASPAVSRGCHASTAADPALGAGCSGDSALDLSAADTPCKSTSRRAPPS